MTSMDVIPNLPYPPQPRIRFSGWWEPRDGVYDMTSAFAMDLGKWGTKGVLGLLEDEIEFYSETDTRQWSWWADEIDSFSTPSKPRFGQVRRLILTVEGQDLRFKVGRMFWENAKVILPTMEIRQV